MHPDLFEMAGVVKRAGCDLSVTTNGQSIDAERSERIVEIGFDAVAFSLAGVGESNDSARGGTRTERVVESIEHLARARERLGSAPPRVHVAYMLLRSGLADLERLAAFLEPLPVDEVVISTLDYVPSHDLENERLAPEDEAEYEDLRERLERAAAAIRAGGTVVQYQIAHRERRRRWCTENVRGSCVVSVEGNVWPCVLALAAQRDGRRSEGEGRGAAGPQAFGNIAARPLPSIWRDRRYVAFRGSFRKGPLAELCRRCPKLRAHVG